MIENKLAPPPTCPNCYKGAPAWHEFLGASGLMRCVKELGGCGIGMTLNPKDPEDLKEALEAIQSALAERDSELATLREVSLGHERRYHTARSQLADLRIKLAETKEVARAAAQWEIQAQDFRDKLVAKDAEIDRLRKELCQ